MRRRTFLTGTVLSGILVAGCTSDDDTGDDGDGGGDSDSETDADSDNGDDDAGEDDTDSGGDSNGDENGDGDDGGEPEQSTLESVRTDSNLWDEEHDSFSGDTQTVENISVDGAFTVFDFTHEGDGNFQIQVLEDGEFVENGANEIGEVDGVRGFALGQGEYQLEINANGPWELRVAQPTTPDGEIHLPPADASNNRHDVVGPIELSGGETVTTSHQGDEIFIVQAWDEGATDLMGQEIWLNEIGEHEGEVVNSLSGVCWVAVQGNGEWTLEIE